MNKRPKSREETPKEGSDSDQSNGQEGPRRYRTPYETQKPGAEAGLPVVWFADH